MASIKNHPITFEEFMELGGNLQKRTSGYLANFRFGSSLCSCEMSTADVSNVDERLPKVIDAMFEVEGQCRTDKSLSRVYVQAIKTTRRFWDHPVHVRLSNNQSVYIHKIVNIFQKSPSNGDTVLEIECSRYVNTIDDIPYITTSTLNTVHIPAEELERFYPGWQTRLEVLSELGYSSSELANQVFQKPQPVANMPMDNVSFD